MKRMAVVLMLASIVSPVVSPATGGSLHLATTEGDHPPGCPWDGAPGPCPHEHDGTTSASGPRLVDCHEPGPTIPAATDLRLAPPAPALRVAAPAAADGRLESSEAFAGVDPPPPSSPPPRGIFGA